MAVNVHEPQQSFFSHRNQAKLSQLFGYLALILLVVAIGAPIFWMITASVKTNAEVFSFPP
jgi:ABC-type glycerol-3-phosphate transport system permease component